VHPFRAVLKSALCLRALPARTWRWIGLYVLTGSALLGLIVFLWRTFEDDIEASLTAYFFPDSWGSIARWIMRRLLAAQTAPLVVSAVASLAGLLVTLLLFPLKSRISASYDAERGLAPEPPQEMTLRVEAWEEVKLFLAFLALQASLFWLGYFEIPALKVIAAILSYGVLFATYAINFIAPLWQRRHGYYSQTVKALALHPLSALTFGAIFALPSVVTGLLFKAYLPSSRLLAVTILFFVAVLSTAWAQAAGTEVAAHLYGRFRATRRAGRPARVLAALAVVALLAGNGVLFFSVARSVHHKSQILKCRYDIDFKSAKLDLPSLGDLFQGKVAIGVSVGVRIENPTPYDVDVERNRVEVRHQETLVAKTEISPFTVPAGARVQERLSFRATVNPKFVLKGLSLFKSGWTITLYMLVEPGFDFPVYLLK
jgi:hypothetical protein